MLLIIFVLVYFLIIYFLKIFKQKIYRNIIFNLPKILFNKKEYKNLTLNTFYKNQLILKHNFDNIPKFNTIFVANYPITKIEYMISNIIPVDICLVASSKISFLLNFFYNKENFILANVSNKNSYNNVEKKIKNKIKTKSIFSYVENIDGKKASKSSKYIGRIGSGKNQICQFRTGMFNIAKNNNLPITPIFIDYIVVNENGYIPKQNLEIKIGPTQIMTDNINIQTYIENIRKFYKNSKKICKINKFNINK